MWHAWQSARVAFADTAGWPEGSAGVAWHSTHASGPGVSQATLFAGAPFGKWQATVHVVGVVAVRGVIVPPAVVVPPVNVYGTSKPNVAPVGWQVLHANRFRCRVWTPVSGQPAPDVTDAL